MKSSPVKVKKNTAENFKESTEKMVLSYLQTLPCLKCKCCICLPYKAHLCFSLIRNF